MVVEEDERELWDRRSAGSVPTLGSSVTSAKFETAQLARSSEFWGRRKRNDFGIS